jgi:hypothetical protein
MDGQWVIDKARTAGKPVAIFTTNPRFFKNIDAQFRAFSI